MIIYHLSNGSDNAEIENSIYFKNDNSDFVYSVYKGSNINSTIN